MVEKILVNTFFLFVAIFLGGLAFYGALKAFGVGIGLTKSIEVFGWICAAVSMLKLYIQIVFGNE